MRITIEQMIIDFDANELLDIAQPECDAEDFGDDADDDTCDDQVAVFNKWRAVAPEGRHDRDSHAEEDDYEQDRCGCSGCTSSAGRSRRV